MMADGSCVGQSSPDGCLVAVCRGGRRDVLPDVGERRFCSPAGRWGSIRRSAAGAVTVCSNTSGWRAALARYMRAPASVSELRASSTDSGSAALSTACENSPRAPASRGGRPVWACLRLPAQEERDPQGASPRIERAGEAGSAGKLAVVGRPVCEATPSSSTRSEVSASASARRACAVRMSPCAPAEGVAGSRRPIHSPNTTCQGPQRVGRERRPPSLRTVDGTQRLRPVLGRNG